MVNYVKGDLLESNCDYICHQVNCQGVMGSGIAKQIREKWPEVYEEYKIFCEDNGSDKYRPLLGSILRSSSSDSRPRIINLFSQDNYGYDGARYTSYDAFATCLVRIRNLVPLDCSIGFPKGIGCGLGGGDWKVIEILIDRILGRHFDVYIYEREEQ